VQIASFDLSHCEQQYLVIYKFPNTQSWK